MKFKEWGSSLRSLLSRSEITEVQWQEVTDSLLLADIGNHWTQIIVQNLRTAITRNKDLDLDQALQEVLLSALEVEKPRTINLDAPLAVIAFVGVNGVGKTTSIGKYGYQLTQQGKKVVFAAGDTFRAAAVDQLKTWADRALATCISGNLNSDPASVVHEAIASAIQTKANLVLLDTAGRLHTKTALMDELGKVLRVAAKNATVTEVLLVMDATTGQNGLTQAKVFAEAVDVTGVVLTKFDGTAKGGIVIAVQQELGIPVKLIGSGEGIEDLKPFDPQEFVSMLLETNS
jgi:fused signal recognition particle receptor